MHEVVAQTLAIAFYPKIASGKEEGSGGFSGSTESRNPTFLEELGMPLHLEGALRAILLALECFAAESVL